MSGVPLSIATIVSGSRYETSGAVTPPGGALGVPWNAIVTGTVAPLPTDLTVYNGSLTQQLAAAGGSAVFTNATLLALGVPADAAGVAVSGLSGVPGGTGVSDEIAYRFLVTPLPTGVSLLLWDSGAPGQTEQFSFAAADGNTPVGTADWTYTPLAPFGSASGATVGGAAGAPEITTGTLPGTNPDAVVVVTPDVPITSVTVSASAAIADTWGLALVNAVAQNGVACFVAGTALATPAGPVAVERLAPGDCVLARGAGAARIVWVGRRSLTPRRHADPDAVWPFRILRDAVAPGVPARDLLLSPDHAVGLGGVLIPVKYLANGQTVFQDRGFETVEYWHVELARHDLLLAEALPAESYLDTGNRDAFGHQGSVLTLHPQFGRNTWERDACAPLWGQGGPVDHVRALLLARARALYRQRAGAAAAATGEG